MEIEIQDNHLYLVKSTYKTFQGQDIEVKVLKTFKTSALVQTTVGKKQIYTEQKEAFLSHVGAAADTKITKASDLPQTPKPTETLSEIKANIEDLGKDKPKEEKPAEKPKAEKPKAAARKTTKAKPAGGVKADTVVVNEAAALEVPAPKEDGPSDTAGSTPTPVVSLEEKPSTSETESTSEATPSSTPEVVAEETVASTQETPAPAPLAERAASLINEVETMSAKAVKEQINKDKAPKVNNKDEIIKALKAGSTAKEIAEALGVKASYVGQIKIDYLGDEPKEGTKKYEVLKLAEGNMPPAEIAEKLGTSESFVKQQINLAKKRQEAKAI